MTSKYQPSSAILHELLEVDFGTGTLTWKPRNDNQIANDRARASWNKKNAGKPAINCANSGYYIGSIHKRVVLAHRVIWAMAYGEWPIDSIDHIDGNGLNNRLQNLRAVTHADNARNHKLRASNKSGVPGIRHRNGRWAASIGVTGVLTHLGTYPTFEEAFAARKGAEKVLGYHTNHGRMTVCEDRINA